MIIVAAGSGSRFDGDKMLALVNGIPLVALTVSRVRSRVDHIVLVHRPDQTERLEALELGATMALGGATRTESEMAGLNALDDDFALVGIHDGARPNVEPDLIEMLFATADRVGGAVPILPTRRLVVDRESLRPMRGASAVQTPQVFRSEPLVSAYREAANQQVHGFDTVEIVQRFTNLKVAAVPGNVNNLKVTYPEDLERVTPL